MNDTRLQEILDADEKANHSEVKNTSESVEDNSKVSQDSPIATEEKVAEQNSEPDKVSSTPSQEQLTPATKEGEKENEPADETGRNSPAEETESSEKKVAKKPTQQQKEAYAWAKLNAKHAADNAKIQAQAEEIQRLQKEIDEFSKHKPEDFATDRDYSRADARNTFNANKLEDKRQEYAHTVLAARDSIIQDRMNVCFDTPEKKHEYQTIMQTAMKHGMGDLLAGNYNKNGQKFHDKTLEEAGNDVITFCDGLDRGPLVMEHLARCPQDFVQVMKHNNATDRHILLMQIERLLSNPNAMKEYKASIAPKNATNGKKTDDTQKSLPVIGKMGSNNVGSSTSGPSDSDYIKLIRGEAKL